jgi:CRISPR/Cas system-associated exonuclease Cas4 (RecB family)
MTEFCDLLNITVVVYIRCKCHYLRPVFLKLVSGVRGSERRKCVMAEEFYWACKIFMYECKLMISFNYDVFDCYSVNIPFSKHCVYHFYFLI